jgi:hypothetical protein
MRSASQVRKAADSVPRPGGRSGQAGVQAPARRGLLWWIAAIVLAAALVAWGSVIGLWYLPFTAGVLLGVATRLGRLGLIAGATGLVLLGPGAWGAVLAAMTLHGEAIGATARIAAAIAGLPPLAALTVILTLLIASLQAIAGLWLGRALTPRGAWRSGNDVSRVKGNGGPLHSVTDNK